MTSYCPEPFVVGVRGCNVVWKTKIELQNNFLKLSYVLNICDTKFSLILELIISAPINVQLKDTVNLELSADYRLLR